ncbi:hypothetical protein M5K25_002844 [Dendrobium thyrsiflorum]|uniref:Uncharacterized protein n=1 Tax=Dendrobium thyrsiflorum TaxID=117978 RepID=A0ABD0VNI1_DENTH
MHKFFKGKVFARVECNTSHRSVDDSIYTGQPKSTTQNPKWPEDHNVILGELLLEQYVNDNFCNENLQKEQWSTLVAALNRRLGSKYTESSVMIRFKNMKADFKALYQLTNRSGWGWDEELHVPVAPDELWDEIVQVNPKLIPYRRHPFHQYTTFEKICAENIAIGSSAKSTKTSETTVNLEEYETPHFADAFMSANGVSYDLDGILNSNLPDVVDDATPSVDVDGSPMVLMSNYLRGVIPDVLCDLVDVQLHVNDAIVELSASIFEEDFSSDDEQPPRRPMYDRTYTGHRYVLDVLVGHPGRAYQCFRLPPEAFVSLTDLLVSRGHLRDTKNMLAAEQLGIFLRGVAHAHSYRQLCEFFQHSRETVSRYFNAVLRTVVSFADEFINLPQGDVECHPFVRSNAQFYPYFKNAIGAIDGTHIPAVVNNNVQNRYRNRKGFTSQNVMAAVSFDRQFVYLATGWECSAADMRVLRWAAEQGQFAVPRNYYYLVDSGYANTDKLIAPFQGYRYHLSDYRRNTSRRYAVQQELFNHRHAQLRNVVERTFDIWKERFQVLTHMRQFSITVQADLVIVCAILHNYIGRYHGHDMYFNMSQTEMEHDNERGEVDMSDEDPNLHTTIGERIQGEVVRHDIAIDMWNDRDYGPVLVTIDNLKAALQRRGPDSLGTRKVLIQLEYGNLVENAGTFFDDQVDKSRDPFLCSGKTVNCRISSALETVGTQYVGVNGMKSIAQLDFIGAMLQLRGLSPVSQPLEDASGNLLVYNGEIFGGIHVADDSNDLELLLHELERCCSSDCLEFNMNGSSNAKHGKSIPDVLSTIKGPWAFIYWQEKSKTMWFGRDALGRRSLLVHWPTCTDSRFILSSVSPLSFVEKYAGSNFINDGLSNEMVNEVTGSTHEICYWEELPCGIYSIEFKISNENAHIMKEGLLGVVQKHRWRNPHLTRVISWDRLLVDPKVENVIPIQASQFPSPAGSLTVHSEPAQRLLSALRSSVMRRTKMDSIFQTSMKKFGEEETAPVAVLFSGGLDSMILSALLDQCLNPQYIIDLLNVSFDGQFAPDRVSARLGLRELQKVAPMRRWRLVEIDATILNLTKETTKHVMSLIHPADTYMDLNIGMALWLAAGGDGCVDGQICNFLQENQHHYKYKSEARVLLVGSGADEQCAGYGRHRTKYKHDGYAL